MFSRLCNDSRIRSKAENILWSKLRGGIGIRLSIRFQHTHQIVARCKTHVFKKLDTQHDMLAWQREYINTLLRPPSTLLATIHSLSMLTSKIDHTKSYVSDSGASVSKFTSNIEMSQRRRHAASLVIKYRQISTLRYMCLYLKVRDDLADVHSGTIFYIRNAEGTLVICHVES